MTVIVLPNVAVSRKLADRLIDLGNLETDVPLRLDSRELDLNTESFVVQLVERAAGAGISCIEVLGGGKQWFKEVADAAKHSGLSTQIVTA